MIDFTRGMWPEYFKSLERRVCVVNTSSGLWSEAFKLAGYFREKDILASCDLMGRSVEKQMKHAEAMGYRYVVFV